MEKTSEYENEIRQLVNMAKNYIPFDCNYLEHYIIIEPAFGYLVLLDNNYSLTIPKSIVLYYKDNYSHITEKDLRRIAESLKLQ